MDANSDSHDPLSFSEDSRVMDDGTCSVNGQTVNFRLHINLDLFLPMKCIAVPRNVTEILKKLKIQEEEKTIRTRESE